MHAVPFVSHAFTPVPPGVQPFVSHEPRFQLKATEAHPIDISEDEALPQISLWLLPPNEMAGLPSSTAMSTRSSLVQLSNAVMKANKLPGTMEPHMTLIGNVGLSKSDAMAKLQLLKGSGPVSVVFEKVIEAPDARGKVPWYQACIAAAKATPQLLVLQRKCREVMFGEAPPRNAWAPPSCVPHLSLAYAPNGELSPVVNGLPIPPPFVATTLALCITATSASGGSDQAYESFVAGEWQELARVAL